MSRISAQKLLTASEGILGEIITIVTKAAVSVIQAGEEHIRTDVTRDSFLIQSEGES